MDLPSAGKSRFLGENAGEYQGPKGQIRYVTFDPAEERRQEREAEAKANEFEKEKSNEQKRGLQEAYDSLDVVTQKDPATQAPVPKSNAGRMERGTSVLDVEYPTPAGAKVPTSITLDKYGQPSQKTTKARLIAAGPSIGSKDAVLDERLLQDGIYTEYEDPSSQDGKNYERQGDFDDFIESEDPDIRQKAVFGSMRRNKEARQGVLTDITIQRDDLTAKIAELKARDEAGSVIFEGVPLDSLKADAKIAEMQKKRAQLDQQKTSTEALFASRQAGNDLKYVRNKALSEGRDPEEDPIYKALKNTYAKLGREVDAIDLTVPAEQASDPIARSNFFESKGVELEAKEKARLLEANRKASDARANIEVSEASKQHLLKTAPFEALRKRTDALVKDTNLMREEAAKRWNETPERDRQLFVERFRGRQEAIAKAQEELGRLAPEAQQSAVDVNSKIESYNTDLQKKNEQIKKDFDQLNNDTKIKLDAVQARNTQKYEQRRAEQQKKLEGFNAELSAALQSGKDENIQAVSAKIVDEKLLSKERMDQAIATYKAEAKKTDTQPVAADILGTLLRGTLIASQETAAGAYRIGANHLRSKLSGGRAFAPEGKQTVEQGMVKLSGEMAGIGSLFANPGTILTQGSKFLGDKVSQGIGDSIFEAGLKTTTGRNVVESIIDLLDSSADSAKGNIKAIEKAVRVDEDFAASNIGQILKVFAEVPWMVAPYVATSRMPGKSDAGMSLSFALNASRLYTEARDDQDQAYKAKTQAYEAGKGEKPEPMSEADMHLAALQYAGFGGLIDTAADRIGLGIVARVFKKAAKLSSAKAAGGLANFFENMAGNVASNKLPLYVAAPLGGVVEMAAEDSQQILMNSLAADFKNWDKDRKLTDGLIDTSLVAFTAGLLLPIGGAVTGGAYRRYVAIPQMAADNAGLDLAAGEYRALSRDVAAGGWADFARIVVPETAEGTLAAKSNTPEAQLRGNGVNWVIANGEAIDQRLSRLDDAIAKLPQSEGRQLRVERNHLLNVRASLVDGLQNDAQIRSQLWQEISRLSNQPLAKGEQGIHELALVAAKLSMGAPLTKEEAKLKANGMPIIQKLDGQSIVSPSFMRFVAGKLPTLEAVIESNRRLFEEPQAYNPESSVPPLLDESPSQDEVNKRKQLVADYVAKRDGQVEAETSAPPEEQTERTTTSPAPASTWNVAFTRRIGRRRTDGTTTVTAQNASQAKLEALKKLRAEDVPGDISIGLAEKNEQLEIFPDAQQPLLNTAKELARRGSTTTPNVNRYQRRLKGETPQERFEDAKKRVVAFASAMKNKYGQKISFAEDSKATSPFAASLDQEGAIIITINPARFEREDRKNPEYNNRALAEEIFHAADFISSNLEAEKAGRTDKLTFRDERRSALYQKLREIGRTNEKVGQAILASASLYADLDNKEGGLTVDDTIGLLSMDQTVNDGAFMSELLRQLNNVKATENIVELNRAKRQAKSGLYKSLDEAIQVVKTYLKSIYRAILGIRSGLQNNPEVADELDATLQNIRDILDENDLGPAPISRETTRKLRDQGLTIAEINKLTPEEAEERLNSTKGKPTAPVAAERLKNQTAANVRGTRYGQVKFDFVVVPLSQLKGMGGTELQPRNRSGDKAYDEETLKRANDLNPLMILTGNVLDTGAPTVILSAENPYGVNASGYDIIAGHGRVDSIGVAPEDRKAAYLAAMIQAYPELAEKIDETRKQGEFPVLVRQINWSASQDASLGTPKQQLRRIARDANLGTGNSNQSEIALTDAMEVKDDSSLSSPPEFNGSLLDAVGNPVGNREVLDKWFKIFGSPREFLSGNGYTPAFEDRVRNAIVAYSLAPMNQDGTINLDNITFNLINTLVSENVAKEANLLNLRSGLHKAAPSLFKARQKFQELEPVLPQESRDSNPVANIQRAIVAYLNYRTEQVNSGKPLSEIEFDKFVNQGQLFGEVITPIQAMILAPIVQENGASGFMEFGSGDLSSLRVIRNAKSIKSSPDRIAAYLSAYATAIADAFSEYGAEAALPGMERILNRTENAIIIQGALEKAGSIYAGTTQPNPQMPDTTGLTLQALNSKYDDDLFGADLGSGSLGTETVSASMDEQVILNRLGAAAYTSDLPGVAVKELVQNAFDAVKANGGGKVDVTIDSSRRSIRVTDNGSGMDAGIIKNGFLRVGGSIKTTKASDTSGGLGLAKIAFLFGSEEIILDSVKNGVRYKMRMKGGSYSALQNVKIEKEPSDAPNGTSVTVIIPSTYKDANGEDRYYYFPSEPEFLQEPMIGPVDVTLNGKLLEIGNNAKNLQKETEFDFSWGRINLYIDPRQNPYPRVRVLSAGLKQFNATSYDVFGGGDNKLPYDLVLDVRPNVGPDSLAYPINNTREGWRATVKDDIEAMYTYLKDMALEQRLKNAKEAFDKLEFMPLVDLSAELTEAELNAINNARFKDPGSSVAMPKVARLDFSDGDKVVRILTDGTTTEVPRAQYVPKSFKADRKIDFRAIGTDTSKMDPKSPLFNNNTNLVIDDIPESRPLFASVGSSFLEFVREFGNKVKVESLGRSYGELAKETPDGWFVGVSLDKKYRGLNMVKPFQALLINPLLLSTDAMSGPLAAAAETVHIYIHEITHVLARNEGAGFTSEFANNDGRIVKYGVNKELAIQKLAKIYTKYWPAMTALAARFADYNTSNNAESFKSSAESLGLEGGYSPPPQEQLRGLRGLAAKYDYSELFNDTEESSEEIGATEESARIAGEVRNIIAPPESQKRGSGGGERNERVRPGGKIINSFVRSQMAERFYIRGYGQDELRELAYDKIMDLLSRSPSGRAIAKQYLATNPSGTDHPEGVMLLVRDLVARAKKEGNKNPTGTDLLRFMTPEEQSKGFTETQIEAARAERHLYNHILRSLTNMVAKMTGNETELGRVVAQSEIENRKKFLKDDADGESEAEFLQEVPETSISEIPLAELAENFKESLADASGTPAKRMLDFITPQLSKVMQMHVQGMSNKDIADELGLKDEQRPDAKVWRYIQEGYQRMRLGLDFLQSQRDLLQSKQNKTEEEEESLDEINRYLGGFSKKDLDAVNEKVKQAQDFKKALEETRVQKGEPVQGSLFAKADKPGFKTAEDFADPNKFYRVFSGNQAYEDILESGKIRTQGSPSYKGTNPHLNEPGASLAERIKSRPTAWPSFAKGKANLSYARELPDHYIIETEENLITPKRGRHSPGSTYFPMDDKLGLDVDETKTKIYKHVGEGKYEQVPSTNKGLEKNLVSPTAEKSEKRTAPDARIVTKYYELQDKIRAGEITPAEMDMYDKIESMAIKYKWPGVPVQARLFDLAQVTRRELNKTPATPADVQMELMLDDDTKQGMRSLLAKPILSMTEQELEEGLNGDWITSEEIAEAMGNEEVGQTRGLADYGETDQASAGIRTAQDSTPRPTTRSMEQVAAGAAAITDEAILAKMRTENRGRVSGALREAFAPQLSDEETIAARRASNRAWEDAMDSGDETAINRAFLITRDYIKTGTEQARGLAARRARSQGESNRDALLFPIAPNRSEIVKETKDQVARARIAIQTITANIQDARSKLSAADQNRPDWKAWFERQEQDLARNVSLLEGNGVEESVVAKKRKKADEALGKIGTSIANLDKENTLHKLRTGETMNQILSSIGDPLLREGVRMYTQGMSVADIEKALGMKGMKIKIQKAIVNGLHPEVDRRFKRLFDEVSEKGLTQKQLMARLRKLSDGQPLLAKSSDIPDSEIPLTPEEARQMILDSFGLTTENLSRETSSPLFNYADIQQVSKLNSVISEAVEPASWARIASDVFAAFIFTGAPSLVANIGLTPFARFTVPAHLFLEALTTQFRPKTRIADGEDIIGAPYRNLGEALVGGAREATASFMTNKLFSAALKAAGLRAIEAFHSEVSSFGQEQGVAPMSLIERESSGSLDQGMTKNAKTIPGKLGKSIRVGLNLLLAGDEFSKNIRANMYVGAFAYRVGKAKGLSGDALNDFIENQMLDQQSTAWRMAVNRTLVDTFAQNLSSTGKINSVGEMIGFVPERLKDANTFIGKLASGSRGMQLGGRRLSAEEFIYKFAQSFLILIKSPYNLTRASAAYSPLAFINVAKRASAGKQKGVDPSTGEEFSYMEGNEFNMLAQRHAEAMLGLAGMALLWSALEGDDEDNEKRLFGIPWMPKMLITGSSSSGPRTRYGNQATTIQIGNFSFPYGRYEPLSGLAYLADFARETKQIMKGRGSAGDRVIKWGQDFMNYPFSKTFSKAYRDLAKVVSIKGIPEVVQGRLASIMVPNLFRRFFEPGAVTLGSEEWDAERLSGWSVFELGGWVNATLPGLPSLLDKAGVKNDLALPPRYKSDLSVKERDVGVFEDLVKKIGVPDRGARLVGGFARGVLPGGLAYKTPKMTKLERFSAAYNSRFPQTAYNPKPPNKYIQIKDKDGITKNEMLSPKEYKKMVDMAATMTTSRINSILTEENIANPNQNIRKLVDKVREDAMSKARDAVRRARRAEDKKAVEPTVSR